MYKIFFGFFFGFAKISSTFAPSKGTLSYGVMVTQQILVLLFQVRILVAQQERMVKGHPFFLLSGSQASFTTTTRATGLFLCQVVSPSFSKEGLGRIVKVSPQKGLLLAGMPGDGYGGGNWLLREPWARSVTPFPCLPAASSPPFTKGGFRRDFKCREAEGHPLLFAKGFARVLGDWLLRELWARSVTPFPSARRGGPCKLRHKARTPPIGVLFIHIGYRPSKLAVPYMHKKPLQKQRSFGLYAPFAERRGFEPLKHFWRLLTFQASQFNHSCTSPFCGTKVA